MSVIELDRTDCIFTIRLNRPERMNALGAELRAGLADAWTELRENADLEVAILTGTGRAFCAGEDMKETVERGRVGEQGQAVPRSADNGAGDKPIITAINGYAMGGGFMLAERGDLRVAVPDAILEVSEAKRWLLGGYSHGFVAALPHAITAEMAFAFRFTAERLYQLGWINRLAEPEELMATARRMAEHLLSLPPASRVNTLTMLRSMRPALSEDLETLAGRLRNHGAMSDLMESRKAFAEKRAPAWKGWDDPADRAKTPGL